MPHFQVEMVDGTRKNIEAQRMTHSGDRVVFEHRPREAWTDWTAVFEVSATEVAEIRRRVTEHNGSHRWIRQRARTTE